MPTLDAMRAFIAVAEHGGFTSAAKHLVVTAMALSKQVKRLEEELGLSLLKRTTQKVSLTDFGSSYLEKCRSIVNAADELEQWSRSFHSSPSGRLEILAAQPFSEYLMMPHLAEFRELYPDIQLHINYVKEHIHPSEMNFDLAFGMNEYLGRRQQGLKRRLLFETELSLYASPDYLDRYGMPQTPRELLDHWLIADGTAEPRNLLPITQGTHYYEPANLSYVLPRLAVECTDYHGRFKLACDGLGIWVGYKKYYPPLWQALEEGRLVKVLEEYWLKPWPIYLYYQVARYEQPKLRAFIDFMMDRVAGWEPKPSR
ncbi:LysR family transcriptional regulator [Dongshaea marina]|uniref:LysR family transcriptional regulator n=1 Tax=Dongshaea marina TaxID=2047966 RepID=UPI00131F1672|nr:LysR family transcriptional regulator [Dongshaea marina]